MGSSEIEINKNVASRFLEAFGKKSTGLDIHLNDRWEIGSNKVYFDLLISKGANILAVIEVKIGLENKNVLARAMDQVRSGIMITSARFGIVTDGLIYFIYDRKYKDQDFEQKAFGEIIEILISPSQIRIYKKDRDLVANIILEAAYKYFDKESDLLTLLNEKSFITHIHFDSNTNSFYFFDKRSGTSSFENKVFNAMFGEFKEKEICRYTSLNSLYSSLNNISFRMSGLVGMNDKSEVNYVDTYLNGIEKPLIKEHHNTITAINTRYITSCSNINNVDNLTLWRLYSEDSKGVCLIFDTRLDNLGDYVLLQKVKYADKDGMHKELEFLKEVKLEVERMTGFDFEFKKIGYWKHFFKPYEYSIEEEIRLLIIDNKSLPKLRTDWVMTYSHSILNPIIDFRLNIKEFPIQLKRIVLGPKCPEQEINKVQIEELIRRKKKEIVLSKMTARLQNVKVSLSKIKHYR